MNELKNCFDYIAELDNHYALAMYRRTLECKQRYENYHFNEVIENNNIHFDYKIKPGKANTRNAIELLKITSFPAKIYERAKDNVSNG
ncbi:MutS-related protein, family 1 [Staphylococcus aureus]|nr:MutS-related protein, family 1 [Staphylococcus aureus]